MKQIDCKYCQSPLENGDLDENGNPFCTCGGAKIERLRKVLKEITKQRYQGVSKKLAEKALEEI